MANQKNRDNIPDGYVDIYSSSNKKSNASSVTKRAVITLLSVLFIFSGALMLWGYSSLTSINTVDLNAKNSSLNSLSESDTDLGNTSGSSEYQVDFSSKDLLSNSSVLNIMLFGQDNANGAEFGRSDTMILLTLDNNNKQLKMTSFMRDLWVNIPDYGMQRLNIAYALGGAPKTVATIEANFGIKIDRYAVVDYASFVSIIDVLGGLDIELTDEEIDYINWQTWKNKQADTRYELQVPPGVVHLNGRQALWHARNRGQDGICSGDDFTRTQRQRNVLKTLMENFQDASLPQIVSIVNKVGPMVTTDLSYYEITVLVANALSYLKYDTCEYRLPQYSNVTDARIYGMSVLVIPDWELARRELAQFVFYKAEVESDTE